MDLLGIFHTPIAKVDNFLSDFECDSLLSFAQKCNYYAYDKNSLTTFGSCEKNVLGKYFPDINLRVEMEFDKFAYQTLKHPDTCNFKIMDSWATLTEPNGESVKHTHANCYWCGVLYITDDTSPITFYRPKVNTSFALDVYEQTEWSCNSISHVPEKGQVVFFPHWLMHKVELNRTNNNRHSITFNIFPNGVFGMHDSTANIKVLKL